MDALKGFSSINNPAAFPFKTNVPLSKKRHGPGALPGSLYYSSVSFLSVTITILCVDISAIDDFLIFIYPSNFCIWDSDSMPLADSRYLSYNFILIFPFALLILDHFLSRSSYQYFFAYSSTRFDEKHNPYNTFKIREK